LAERPPLPLDQPAGQMPEPLLHDRARPVRGARVDDEPPVDVRHGRVEARPDLLGRVLDDHGDADGHAERYVPAMAAIRLICSAFATPARSDVAKRPCVEATAASSVFVSVMPFLYECASTSVPPALMFAACVGSVLMTV